MNVDINFEEVNNLINRALVSHTDQLIVDYKKKFSSMELINQLMMQLYGVTKTLSTKPAPPRQCLDIFGGYMNIDQFRENNVLNYRLNLINSNFIFPEITEINTIKVKPNENKNLRLTRPNQS